jgi:hypothetical protein
LTTLASVRAVKVTAVEKVVSRYGITVVLAAGLGLRQGEVFGLSPTTSTGSGTRSQSSGR